MPYTAFRCPRLHSNSQRPRQRRYVGADSRRIRIATRAYVTHRVSKESADSLRHCTRSDRASRLAVAQPTKVNHVCRGPSGTGGPS